MAIAIASMLIVEANITGELALPPLVVFAVLSAIGPALGVRALRSIELVPPRPTRCSA